jgi:hypothetical protein
LLSSIGPLFHHESYIDEYEEICMARGGSNSKKYDLIDWKTVRSMKDKGRLEMKGSENNECGHGRQIIVEDNYKKSILVEKYIMEEIIQRLNIKMCRKSIEREKKLP